MDLQSMVRDAVRELIGGSSAPATPTTADTLRDTLAHVQSTPAAPAPDANRRTGVATVTYTALPASNVRLTPVLATVHGWLSAHANATARDVELGTGLGKKSVQSALHTLRTMGVAKSTPIPGVTPRFGVTNAPDASAPQPETGVIYINGKRAVYRLCDDTTITSATLPVGTPITIPQPRKRTPKRTKRGRK